VLDMTQAVLVEVYREYGMKFEEATKEIQKAISEPESPQRKKVTAQDEAASMAMLQSMMGGSDFKGPKG
jgi:hypothetical protein